MSGWASNSLTLNCVSLSEHANRKLAISRLVRRQRHCFFKVLFYKRVAEHCVSSLRRRQSNPLVYTVCVLVHEILSQIPLSRKDIYSRF